MKTMLLVIGLLVTSSSPIMAQGIVLAPGESYLFSQPSRVNSYINEGFNSYFSIQLGFGRDLFLSGESLRVDVLSSPTSSTPILMTTFTSPPWNYPTGVEVRSAGSWDPSAGAVRVTMFGGSLEISSVLSISANPAFVNTYVFPVPEPSSVALMILGALGSAAAALVFCNSRESSPQRLKSICCR